MMQLIFKNRYAALIWVGLSLFGAAALVGEGGGIERVDQTAAQMRSQAQELSEVPAPTPSESEEAAEGEEALSEAEGDEQGKVFTGPDGRRYRVVTREDAGKLGRGEEID